MVRHRYNANKADANPPAISRKTLKKVAKDAKEAKAAKNEAPVPSTKANTIVPSVDTAFKTFISARFCSAIWAYISDCDETFNYWEPLHYVIFGNGLQTWEYSPQFALRSWTYLLAHGVPGWIYHKIFNPSPLLIFYLIRCILGFGCAVVERYLYKAICREFGIHIGRLWLIFQVFSVGMFISSTALLPSSFSMCFSCAALAAWWHQQYNLAVFFVAISSLLGWPFAVLLGLPIAVDMVFRQKLYKTFFIWVGISAATIMIPMIVIDSSYFGKLTLAPLNIVLYNVFTDHGPNLYGTEPTSFYLINGFLNYNVVWILALFTPALLVIDKFFVPAKSKSTLNFPYYLSLAGLYLWLLVFMEQPHKEERFLFPIYPLISLCGAISLDVLQKIFYRLKSLFIKIDTTSGQNHYLDHSMFIALVVMIISACLGISRVFSIYRNYHAPLEIMMDLTEFKNSPEYNASPENSLYNVCIGKDWYRYPTSFFLPSDKFRIRFLKSEFKGILPAYYSEGENATSVIHNYFNDMNQENDAMYFDYEKCHFLIDLDVGKYTDLEPNYAQRKDWSIRKSLPFLNPEKSNKFLRAFYVPFLSDNHVSYGNFNLLQRKKFKFS